MRGRTVAATYPVYARLLLFVSRNVAVNKLRTPRPAITFPMTAIMCFPFQTNDDGGQD